MSSRAGDELTATSYAVLSQLALRSWSVYEMTRNMGRTLHWFWPRAESVIYGEVKRLAGLGFARARRTPGRRGRDATVYAITPAGKRAIAAWLATPPDGTVMHSEPMLRVHLSPWGTVDDLIAALGRARDEAEALLRVGETVGREFVEERHQFQSQVHIRAILFDGLWSHATAMKSWAERSIVEVRRWRSIAGSAESRRRGIGLMSATLGDADSAGHAVSASVRAAEGTRG